MRTMDLKLRRLVEVRDEDCLECPCYWPWPDDLMTTPIPFARGRNWLCFYRHEVGCPPRGYIYSFKPSSLAYAIPTS